MTFSRSETYVFLEPAKDEQFVTLDELKEKIKGWLERWPKDLEMPMDLTKFNNNLEDAVDHLVKFACELELGGGTGSLQWYEVDLE
ncbi:protein CHLORORESPIRATORY REDUCTION 7, chloroplastic [Cryptomeria japonica]|uniref:protein CHLORORESPIRATORY REDUCTION 7, chloroplastic n=1 Tax=Cryptomeria japonica TaxID=3369 RepID=UPI0025ABC2A1|nr:protein CHLORORESPIRATORY REDUCTION 7, chloroplastic [Cryptomeria japonica]